MIDELKPYPTMKDSGVPWLGEVPAHWDLLPNRALLRLKKQLVGNRSQDYVLLSLTKAGVIARDMENLVGKVPASFESYQVIEAGDLIFCLFDIDETPRTVGLSSTSGMITGAYTRFRCENETAARFIYLLYLAMDDQKSLRPLYSGLRKVITKSTFLSAKLVLPPTVEQRTIVRYVDHVDRRIRRYIRAKQMLIKLLEEQKQAIIHRAVTRGLDPNVRLKPSGVEWLGDVPEHWEVKRTRYLFREVDARSRDGTETRLSMSQKLGLVPSTSIEERRLVSESGIGGKLCEKDDLVLNRLKAHLGVFALAQVPGIVSPDYTVFRSVSALAPRYFELVLRTPACRVELRQRAKGIVEGFWRLYTDDFYSIRLPCPPVQEQQAIVGYLDLVLTKQNRAIARTYREISLIHEYHTSLIADVVTGKLDVREIACHLPAEPSEPVAPNEVEDLTDEFEIESTESKDNYE